MFPFSVTIYSKIGPSTCIPSFLEAALGQVASEVWEPSLQAVLMGAGLTARKFLCYVFKKVGPRFCVPSFSEAALGQVASEGWEPSLQAVLMGAALTARKSFLLLSMFSSFSEEIVSYYSSMYSTVHSMQCVHCM